MKTQRSTIVVLGIHILLLLLAVLQAAGLLVGIEKSVWMMDAETVTYFILMFVSPLMTVVSLVMTAKGCFEKNAALPIVILSVLNLLISIIVWVLVVLVLMLILSIFTIFS